MDHTIATAADERGEDIRLVLRLLLNGTDDCNTCDENEGREKESD